MCDPLTIGSAALMAGGTAANYMASKDVSGARDTVMGNERQRQLALNAEADTVNKGSRDRYDGFAPKQDAKAATLADYFKGGVAPNSGATPTAAPSVMPASSSNITVAEEGKKLGQAQDFSDKQGTALGKLRSFGDLFAADNRLQARDAGSVAQLGGFKVGSAGVVPYELEDANHAGDKTKFIGDILSGVGKIGLGAGLAGGGTSLASMFGGAGAPLSLAAPGVVTGGAGAAGQILPAASAQAFNPFRIY